MYNKSAFTNFNNHNYDFEEKKNSDYAYEREHQKRLNIADRDEINNRTFDKIKESQLADQENVRNIQILKDRNMAISLVDIDREVCPGYDSRVNQASFEARANLMDRNNQLAHDEYENQLSSSNNEINFANVEYDDAIKKAIKEAKLTRDLRINKANQYIVDANAKYNIHIKNTENIKRSDEAIFHNRENTAKEIQSIADAEMAMKLSKEDEDKWVEQMNSDAIFALNLSKNND
jgi:hypothetical protein